jgi:hypothetical protein
MDKSIFSVGDIVTSIRKNDPYNGKLGIIKSNFAVDFIGNFYVVFFDVNDALESNDYLENELTFIK